MFLGLTTIRAFSAEPLLRSEFDYQQDLHTSTWFAFISATRWFGVWLDWIVVIYVAVVVYSFLVLGGDILGGEVGKTSFIEYKCTVCLCRLASLSPTASCLQGCCSGA